MHRTPQDRTNEQCTQGSRSSVTSLSTCQTHTNALVACPRQGFLSFLQQARRASSLQGSSTYAAALQGCGDSPGVSLFGRCA